MFARSKSSQDDEQELDMSKTATKYLYKNLSRTKRIAENPTFKQFSETRKITSEAPRNSAEANVLARLFKSNPVKNELPRIMEGFRRMLGADAQSGGKESASEHKKKKDGGMDGSGQNKALGEVKVNDTGVEHAEDEDEDKTMNPNHEGGSDDDNDEDEDDFAQFDSRLANSDSDSDSELPNPDAMSITPSPRPSPEPAPKKSKPTSTATMAPPTTTTFLPSLSMGGYISASDSESDPDPENSDSGGKPRRKNRMGQQARRALWEKKYGSGANHVRQENQKKKRDRDSGWDIRRGATSGGGGEDGKNRGFKEKVRDWDTKGQSRSQGQGKDKANDDKPLHPSWEAARKAKEQQQGAVSFKGTKVTFD